MRVLTLIALLGLGCAKAPAPTPVRVPATQQATDVFVLKKVEVHERAPTRIVKKAGGHFFVDFGRDAFGWLQLEIDSPDAREVEIHLGEKSTADETVDRMPGGTIRYVATKLFLEPGRHSYRVQTPANKRNTSVAAIRVPEKFGVILPFRYVEILNSPVEIVAANVRQQILIYPFDDHASRFASSDENLDAIWDFCKYSIKATTAFGIYVDGDRERIPYEADAYINQLAHYGVDREYALARHTHEYLLKNPTWPTEWKQHSVLMAHADWMYTGDVESIRRNYQVLKKEKTLLAHARADGLLDTSKLRDIVDWPAGERDGYVMSPVNTVVNAFHYRTLVLMSEMAAAIGEQQDAARFADESRRVLAAFNQKLYDEQQGVYVDGEVGPAHEHASLHANLFALAFGLVPEQRKPQVIAFIKSRGMACSVYPAQFLLESFFESGEAEYALSLITSDGDRGWRNMLRAGSTITLEAWDIKFKPNLDWNHAWGAAPANILPRYVLGVRPLEPGFAKMIIQPQLGPLTQVEGKVPTIRGPVRVKVDAAKRRMEVDIPKNTTARIVLPWAAHRPIEVGAGRHVFEP
ncbi:MAG: alpha-L-rhamnosidase [Phycisphaerales bacterium]|nr:alpha-L-rhamnosidase [Phycisphaerales bacterium]